MDYAGQLTFILFIAFSTLVWKIARAHKQGYAEPVVPKNEAP